MEINGMDSNSLIIEDKLSDGWSVIKVSKVATPPNPVPEMIYPFPSISGVMRVLQITTPPFFSLCVIDPFIYEDR